MIFRFKSLKNLILEIPVVKFCILIFLLTAVFLNFFVSSQYKSSSIIDVSASEAPLLGNSILSTFVDTGGQSESFQLKLFLESSEAAKLLESSINVDNFFMSKDTSYFSRYKNNRNNSFYDYISTKVDISIDPESSALNIDTYAFKKNDALMLNLELINLIVNYQNRTARLTSFNSKTNKVCDLYFINSDVLNYEAILFEDVTIPKDVLSANELLLAKARNFKKFCTDSLEKRNDNELTESGLFPLFELNKLNADASKQVLSQIYEDSIDAFGSSNNIKIIAEPILPQEYENKNIFLFSLLSLIFSYIVIISSRIIIRLNDEFYA
jgi:hypothetical protein